MNLCFYGCGKEGIFYTKSSNRWRCCKNPSKCAARIEQLREANKTNDSYKRLSVKFVNCSICGRKLSAANREQHENICGKKIPCIYCGHEFAYDPSNNSKLTCSDKCKRSHLSKVIREEYASGKRTPRKSNSCLEYDGEKFENDVEILAYKLLKSWKVMNLGHEQIIIPYEFEGEMHSYFPDFNYEDNDITMIVEVKAGGNLKIQDYFKLRAAENLGYGINIWDREAIKKLSSNKD